jgi:hypothetical protein
MTTDKRIDPDSVIDAIARLFPDGFDYEDDDDMGDVWPDVIADDLGITEPDASHQGPIIDVVAALEREGRLRDEGCRWLSLSHEEQARRIVELWSGKYFDIEKDAADIERIANVLAGKTEKRA